MKSPITTYLAKRAVEGPWCLSPSPTDGIEQAVVIPALAESATLFDTLGDLAANDAAQLTRTLIVVVINNRALPHARAEDIADNTETLARLADYAARSPLRLAWVDAATPGLELPAKEGVGLARKIGLDLALAVLDRQGADGPLISLDADTRVGPEYLRVVAEHFAHTPQPWAAVVAYAHPLDGPEPARSTIIDYELFLRAHELGLRRAGSPYAFPTIGSTIVCSPRAYAAVGGMRRKQAAEDFYFLQDLAKTGQVTRITATTVRPAARASHRVPFGTGATLEKCAPQTIYHPESYRVLASFLACAEEHAEMESELFLGALRGLDGGLMSFLDAQGFAKAWASICGNTQSPSQRRTQFHRYFDAFRTLKLFHFLRDHEQSDLPLSEGIYLLLEWCGVDAGSTDHDALLMALRAEWGVSQGPVC